MTEGRQGLNEEMQESILRTANYTAFTLITNRDVASKSNARLGSPAKQYDTDVQNHVPQFRRRSPLQGPFHSRSFPPFQPLIEWRRNRRTRPNCPVPAETKPCIKDHISNHYVLFGDTFMS